MSSKPLFSAAFFLSAPLALAAPLTWGGGSVSLTDGDALAPSSGLWNPDVLENWAVDTGTAGLTDFTVWNNPNEAAFGTTDAGYTVEVGGPLSLSGLSTFVREGPGSGPVVIRGLDATPKTFTLGSGSVINTPLSTTLRLRSDATHALSIVTSNFTKTGSGLLVFDSTTVGNANTAGTITLEEGTLRVLGDRAGIFANQTLALNGPASVFETGQLAASLNSVSGVQLSGFDGVPGSRIQSSGDGISHVAWLNSAADGSIENVLLTDGSPGSRLGLVKAGNKVLTVNRSQSYTGGTTVVNGRLVAGTGGAVPGAVSVSGTGVFEPSAEGAGPASVSVEAGGRLILKPTIQPDRITLLTGGNLEIPSPQDLPASPARLPSWAGILTFGFPLDQSTLASVPERFPGIIALGAPTAENLDFSSSNSPAEARIGGSGSIVYSGLLTPAAGIYRLGGSGTLTLDQTAALTGDNALDVGHNSGWLRAALPAASVVSITGANDLTGAVSVGRAHTLRLEGLSGSLASASAFTLNGGTLALADAVDAGNNNRLTDTAPIQFKRGGSLTYLGTRGLQEQAGEILVLSGEASVSAPGTGIGTAGGATIRFAGLGERGETSTISFSNGTNNFLRFASFPALTNGIWGGHSIAGSANFSDFNPSNGQPRQISPIVITSESEFDSVVAAGNYTFDAAVAVSTAANRSVNSLRAHYATGGPFLVDLGPPSTPEVPNILTLESGGLLLSSNIGGSLAGGALTAGAASGNKLYIFTPATAANSAKTVASPIVDNGTTPVKLIKAGAGQLILTSPNSYSGGTHLNNGNLQIASSADVSVLGSGPIHFDGTGAILSLGNSISPRSFANGIKVNADGTFSVPSGQGINVAFSGPVELAADAVWTITGNVTTLTGAITGDGALRINQGSVHTFSGPESNTFSGGLSLASGTVTLNKSGGALAVGGDITIGDTDGAFAQEILALGASEQIIDTSVVTLIGLDNGNQGVFRLNGNRTETVGGLVSGLGHGVVENGGAAGTSSVLNLANSAHASFGGTLRNHANDDGSRPLTLNKSGGGTQRLAGSNLHTGPTTVSAGTLQLDGTLPSSDVLVQAGGTLSGAGIIGSNVVIEGRHQPGNPGGIQTFAGNLTYATTAHLVVGLQAGSVGPDSFGGIQSSSSVTIGNGAVLDVSLNQLGSTARFSDPFWQSPRSWRILTAASVTGQLTLGSISPDITGASSATFGAFSLTNDATGAALVWTPSGTVPNALQAWRITHFGSVENAGQGADNQDPDNDGSSNLLEFVLGTLPKSVDTPELILTKESSGLEFRFRRNKAAALYLNPVVQWSDDLAVWHSDGVTQVILNDDGISQGIKATVPLGSSNRRFVQLKAAIP